MVSQTRTRLALGDTVEFEGAPTVVRDIVARFTAYSSTWVREALYEGCRSAEDFARRFEQNRAKSRVGSRKGKLRYIESTKSKQGKFT